jgi:hypothetical protein
MPALPGVCRQAGMPAPAVTPGLRGDGTIGLELPSIAGSRSIMASSAHAPLAQLDRATDF